MHERALASGRRAAHIQQHKAPAVMTRLVPVTCAESVACTADTAGSDPWFRWWLLAAQAGTASGACQIVCGGWKPPLYTSCTATLLTRHAPPRAGCGCRGRRC